MQNHRNESAATGALRASDVPREPVEWLWEERIPRGMISLIAGRPGVGKTLLATHVAATVSRTIGDVIFATREDPLRQVARPRLEAARANLKRVHFWSPTLPEDTAALGKLIRKWNVQLVLVDPIAAHLSVSIGVDQEVRRALGPLADLAEDTGAAMLLVGHVVKYVSPRAHPLQAVGGSGGGLAGAARAAFLVGRNPTDADERIVAPIKMNLAPEPKSLAFEVDEVEFDDGVTSAYLIPLGESDVSARALLASGESDTEGRPPEKRTRAAEFLVGYLKLGPRPAKEIREDGQQRQISWATVRRAADEVGVVKSAKGGPKVTWSLPPELLAELDDEDEAA